MALSLDVKIRPDGQFETTTHVHLEPEPLAKPPPLAQPPLAKQLRARIKKLKFHRSRRPTLNSGGAAATTTTSKLLTKEDKKRMERQARKKGIQGLFEEHKVTEPAIQQKIIEGLRDGTLGSHAELERLIHRMRGSSSATGNGREVISTQENSSLELSTTGGGSSTTVVEPQSLAGPVAVATDLSIPSGTSL
jgi:hypothetical protein